MANSSSSGLLTAGVVGGAMTSNNGTIVYCSSTDKSFYCKFVRIFNMLKMIIFFISIFVCLYILYRMYKK